MKSPLINRPKYVVFDGIKSITSSFSIGIPHCSTLGALSFLLFVNDFFQVSEHDKITFADEKLLLVQWDNYKYSGSEF